MKMIRVIKAYRKPNPNNAFGFINLYHSDILDDTKMYDIDESFLEEAKKFGYLKEEDVQFLKEHIIDNQIDGYFLNDNLEEEALNGLKKLLESPEL